MNSNRFLSIIILLSALALPLGGFLGWNPKVPDYPPELPGEAAALMATAVLPAVPPTGPAQPEGRINPQDLAEAFRLPSRPSRGQRPVGASPGQTPPPGVETVRPQSLPASVPAESSEPEESRRFLGTIRDAENVEYAFYKDLQSGRIITIQGGKP